MNERIVFNVGQCPHCGHWHTDLDEFPIYIDGEYVLVPQYCHSCGTTWNSVYKFEHYEEIDVFKFDECKEKE